MKYETKKTIYCIVATVLLLVSVIYNFRGSHSYREAQEQLDSLARIIEEQGRTIDLVGESARRASNFVIETEKRSEEFEEQYSRFKELYLVLKNRYFELEERNRELEEIYRNLGDAEQESERIIEEALKLIEQYENGNN